MRMEWHQHTSDALLTVVLHLGLDHLCGKQHENKIELNFPCDVSGVFLTKIIYSLFFVVFFVYKFPRRSVERTG